MWLMRGSNLKKSEKVSNSRIARSFLASNTWKRYRYYGEEVSVRVVWWAGVEQPTSR